MYFDAQQEETSDSTNLEVLAREVETTKIPIQVTPEEPKYEKQQLLFAWLPTETIKKTYELST